ncbi:MULTISPECIES: gamma-glutamylcyclotransferase [unclassified Roseivivax]|uniref:gamma-glutamylcyclotransferase n=1 Tax=Roseivivax sp. GX 12232 TaxID=2900547 RepID=UPI001E45EFFC|nr:gamma-glutamylcyclotransferase [Roseivivax sp. GX 12232]MCE0505645.1 gamma-glutamylcyclotransferase [Roseivivax sp. GX 12232]
MTLWVFGYGSLLWNPGFEVSETVPARLDGYRRSFCMRSIHHRGTPEDPGLVLALDEEHGSYCDGLALAAAPGQSEEVLAYLRERELVSAAYLERLLPLKLVDGREVTALVYVIDPDHGQYCELPLEEQAGIIAGAHGGRGPNTEYLFNTAAHLRELGIPDAELQWLDQRVRELVA